MAVPCTWPTAVAAIGPTAVGTMVWRDRGAPQLGVVVKARFALRHEATMVIAKAPQLLERDEHVAADPTRSLLQASDMVPYRPMADVWLTGHAFAPRGRMVAVSVVRLALYRGATPLLNKVLHVMGDRPDANIPPQPFAKIPIVYEKAFGGIGIDDNPVGVGGDERKLVPNVVDPDRWDRPAGLGPVSRYWKLRRGTVDTSVRRGLEATTPDVPAGFDWLYFQAAPLDQRVAFLRGDEWLVLDGLHPELVRVQSRLPKARGVARIMSLSRDGRGEAVAMVADTLAIDADEQTCCITWRGSVALDDTLQLDGSVQLDDMLVAGAVELDQQGVDWDVARARAVPPTREKLAGDARVLDGSGITIVGAEGRDELGRTDVDGGANYQRLEVDSGEWSSDAWPMYSLAGIDEEVTETKTSADAHALLAEERATEVGHRGFPLPVDTEPGALPAGLDDELPWVSEPAVEPATEGDAAVEGIEPEIAPEPEPDESPTDRPPDSEPPESTQVMRRHQVMRGVAPLKTPPASPAEPPASPLAQSPSPQSPGVPRPRSIPRPRSGRGPRKALPLGADGPPKHKTDSRSRITSMPPAPLDRKAYEAALRRAGASEADIAALVEALPRDPDPGASS